MPKARHRVDRKPSMLARPLLPGRRSLHVRSCDTAACRYRPEQRTGRSDHKRHVEPARRPDYRREPDPCPDNRPGQALPRSEEHTSELQSLMRISYAVFCLKKKTNNTNTKQM